MRVLMLASEYPPAKVFGLGRAVHDLSRALAAGGDEVHVLTNSIGGRDQDAVMEGVHVHRINFPNPPQPPDPTACVAQFNLSLLARAARVLPSLQPFDIVHAHDWHVALAASWLQRRHDLTLVTTIHDAAVGKYAGRMDRHQQYISFCERWLVGLSARTIAVSEHVKRELVEHYGADSAVVDAIPCGVDPVPFAVTVNLQAFRSVFAAPQDRLLLYVGRLDPEKGVDVLLHALAGLVPAHPELRLVLVGEGTLVSSLTSLAADLGLEARVTFLGYVAHPALAALYQAAEAVIVPSLYEPFGMVALEGMIAGRPVIASRVGGLADIVTDGTSGLAVTPGNSAELARAISRIVSEPEFAVRLATTGREHALRNYSWGRVAERTRQTYVRALTAPPPAVATGGPRA